MLAPLAFLVLAVQSPAADSLRALARQLPESALVLEARTAPLAAREATGDALRAGDLASAQRLASAYAAAWRDSFLVREVARFGGWTDERRAARLRADSVRRAGVAAYSREGTWPAIALWRRALARAVAIGDTALMAGISGNIGAGFQREGRLDSAARYLGRAIALARTVGDYRVEANALIALGAVSEERGDAALARTHYLRALALHERMGDTRGVAAVRNNLGLLAWSAGDLPEAGSQLASALEINERDGRDAEAATNRLNLAGLASLAGEFATAERLYRSALSTWRTREEWADAADALFGLGQLEVRRGNYPAAQQALGDALAIYDRAGPAGSALKVRRALAGVLAARGELQDAIDTLRVAEDRAGSGDAAPADLAGIVLARADLAVQLNALADAERLYVRAERLYRDAGNTEGLAEAQHGRGVLLLTRDDFDGAESMFRSALRVQQAGGSVRAAALTRLALGQLAWARGDSAAARRQLVQAAAELRRAGDPVSLAAALGELAAFDAERGQPAAAEARYREALAAVEGRVVPEVKWRLYAGLAHARRARAASDDAARGLRLAIAEVERAGRSLELPERRSGFLADKWDVYAQLALLERSRGQGDAAFEASERLRAREMLDLLGRGRIGRPAATETNLVEREQDLRRRIAELTGQMEGATDGALRGPALIAEGGAVREALLAAQGAYADLLLEMRERAPRHAELVSSEVAGWREVARQLDSDEAFVEYLVSDSGSVAFVVAHGRLAVVELGIGRHDLANLVAFARGSLESQRPPSDSLWRGPFRRLYRHLIAPVEETGMLAGTRRLLLVPHGELHYLPFAALLSERGPLIGQYDVATTPSATVWLALRRRPARPRAEGVLAMAPRSDALPASQHEVEAVARLAGGRVQLLTGDQATEAAFLRAAPAARVVHLATYGVLNKHNPLFSFVELAPDGGHDGRLDVQEVFGLELNADLVVLSACQTGLGSGRLADVPTGDDWVGLTRAFLHAGARSVVATLWAVDDRATAALMEEFYREHGQGADPARALAGAQRALLGNVATAHPFYWAGVVVAEGGGR